MNEEGGPVGLGEEALVKDIIDNQLWSVDLGQHINHHPDQHRDEHSKVTHQLTNLRKWTHY